MIAGPGAVLAHGDWTSATKVPKRRGVHDLVPSQHRHAMILCQTGVCIVLGSMIVRPGAIA